MNSTIRQGMIPQSSIGQPQAMLSIGNPPFNIQNQVQLGSQQPLGPSSLGIPHNMQSNPPMTMLGGAPVPTGGVPRYPLQAAAIQGSMQQPQHQRQVVPRPQQIPPQLNSAIPNPSQLQSMSFPSTVMQGSLPPNNSIRRAQSQPQINLNPLSGIPPSVPGSISMPVGINQQPTMPGQLRQVPGQQNPHQLHQMRMQHQQQQQQQMSNIDLLMRNHVQPNSASRVGPSQGQVMSSLSQPPPTSMPPHQNAFNNTMPPSQPPRPTSTQGMPMGTPGPSHASINRPRTSPDGSNALPYMGYSPSQFPPNTRRGIPSPGPSSYPFVPATSPPMQLSEIPQTSPPGMMSSQSANSAHKTGFFPTPAQQQLDMTGADMYSPGFSMPPRSMPNQLSSLVPISLQSSLPSTPQTTSLPNPQQQRPPQPSPSPQQQQAHQHPMGHSISSDQIHNLAHSQPQGGPGGVLGSALSTTHPRGFQPPNSSNSFAAGLTAAGRIPVPQQSQAPSLPSQQSAQQSQTFSSRVSVSGANSSSVSTGPVPPSSPSPGAGTEHASGRGKTASAGSPTYYNANTNNNQAESRCLGLMRLLQFSGTLATDNPQKHNLNYWDDVVREYFTPRAIMRLTLWKDNQKIEAKPFEIGVPILPRFFLVTTQSGVKSMSFTLDCARERAFQTGHIVECVDASWTYKYRNGYTVTLRGPLTAHIVPTSKTPPGTNTGNNNDIMYRFEEFQFDANFHDKFIALESILGARSIESVPPPSLMMMAEPSPTVPPVTIGAQGGRSQSNLLQMEDDRKWEEPRVLIDRASLPGEPVNAFGIPQATMRCLELAESVTSMAELIQFAKESSPGDMNVPDALKEFASRLRESGAVLPQHQSLLGHPMNINHPFYQNPSATASSATLYSVGGSPSTTHAIPPGSMPINTATMGSPPNSTPSGVNSPEKQLPKSIPQQLHQPQHSQTSSISATSPAMATATTPILGTGLKRKQTGDAVSPTIGNEQPQKRMARKRGRTGTG